ncbi:MAG: amidophosphoribosyltransferase [Alphaproteobacteria bacterium]|nr:amidophosphoribosyltransferase [Alphaproteobacteria bacterium]
MCGIVGLYLKNPALEGALGRHLATMLIGMSERGPDSAGIAVYRAPVADGTLKLTLRAADGACDWAALRQAFARHFGEPVTLAVHANHALVTLAAAEELVRAFLSQHAPNAAIVGYGQSIEMYKDMGLPAEIVERFAFRSMGGSHAIGHTRMATESAVTTAHSHPFTAAADMCLVHNGSLSNHNRLRQWLRRKGQAFETDNDTEVAARYFAYRLGEGASLKEAMTAGLKDLDGFFTFAMATRDGFAVLRDGIACKPAVMAESDDWVAMASEYRSLAALPGVDGARVWEPEPEVVYSWSRGEAA